ncbi:MAG: hypothetical protein HZA78_09150 [Candidatus Schekmanbacteria bacterium]|nr:hypothetical protein [Candidatus Schekmanbacteria bacterium]
MILNKFTKSQGQAMIEVLVGMVTLMYLFMGFFDLVRALNLYTVLSQSSEEAVRLASMPNNAPVSRASIRQRIITLVSGAGYDTINADIDPTPTTPPLPQLRIHIHGESGARNSSAYVRVSYPFEFYYLRQVIPGIAIPTIEITAARTRSNE